MPELDLQALVRNRTLSAPMAALLVATARERRSFLIVAIPRMAGKSTVMDATLAHAPEGTAIQRLMQHPRDLDRASDAPSEGYLDQWTHEPAIIQRSGTSMRRRRCSSSTARSSTSTR